MHLNKLKNLQNCFKIENIIKYIKFNVGKLRKKLSEALL